MASVIMATYNGVAYLEEAVRSVLKQSWGDFEFLVVDDCSSDRTGELLKSFSDPRISVFRNSSNEGISRSLNRLLEASRGKYIARMDSDDISLPARLETQVHFMESHPSVGICGMWCTGLGDGRAVNFRPPCSDAELRFELFFDNPIPHPTVMLRSLVFSDNALRYDPDFAGAEDYDLWERAADFCQLAVIPENGLEYRFHDDQATTRRMAVQRQFAAQTRRRIALRVIPDAGADDLAMHDRLFSRRPDANREFVLRAGAWLERLAEANELGDRYEPVAFRRRLAEVLAENARLVATRSAGIWSAFHQAPISKYWEGSIRQRAAFASRCAVGRTRMA